jgi:hypothetical protein
MANTFELISAVTVGSGGASSIDFTSIPSTYTDLCFKISGRTTGALSRSESIYLQFNGVTTSSYSYRYIQGSGSAASSSSGSTTFIYIGEQPQSPSTASTFGNADIYIPNYAGSTNKSLSVDNVQEDNQTQAYATLVAGLWSNTAAITYIKVYPTLSNWAQYSTAYLYGVKNA